MDAITRLVGLTLRRVSKIRFRLQGLATIKDVPTDQFHRIVEELLDRGWRKTYEYSGFDAWIDYGQIKLRKGRAKLNLEWDNYGEGSLEGAPELVDGFAREWGLEVVREWRWSEWDK